MKRALIPQLLALTTLLLAALALAGAAGAQGNSTSRYRIGSRDQIQVQVDELPDLESEQVVGEDGTITLPVIGRVMAQGLTEEELAERVREQLEAEGMRRATVSVSISAYRSRPVSILGAIGSPGNHYVPGQATLMEVLLDAGGLTAEHGPTILVRRRADNGLTDQLAIATRDLIELGDPRLNIPIFAGDTINVPPARDVTINILGEVKSSGSLTFRSTERVTLLAAIARAGGLLETAAKKIRVMRQTPQGERRELVVDYRDVLDGRASDLELVDGDLIVVKESFF